MEAGRHDVGHDSGGVSPKSTTVNRVLTELGHGGNLHLPVITTCSEEGSAMRRGCIGEGVYRGLACTSRFRRFHRFRRFRRFRRFHRSPSIAGSKGSQLTQ